VKRQLPVILAAGAGALLAVVLLAFLFLGGDEEPEAGPKAAAPPAEARPGADPPPAGLMVQTRPVTIYRRAETDELALVASTGQIVWFGGPVDRARQIVRLVLEGVDDAEAGVLPVPEGIRFRDVYLDDRQTAWVDLVGSSLAPLAGADEEQALVGSVARSLVDGVDEIERVGFLVDGEPRRSLTGHVDATRTFTGSEWPLVGEDGGVGLGEGPELPAREPGSEAA
jgi:hypothetical protein